MSDTLLTLRDVHINFPARKNWLGKTTEHVHAINGIDLQIRRGETLGIVGESGCGKSTLAQLLMGMLQPSHGQYIRSGSQRIMQMVFQDPLSSLNPRLPVWRIITEPLWIAKRSSEQQRRALAEELAVQVGIRPEYLDRLPHAFSGGQRQRIAIARALSSQPDVIVLDEPTSAMDISVQAQILNLLVTLQENHGLTYVLISHNVSVIRHMSDRVAVMYLDFRFQYLRDRASCFCFLDYAVKGRGINTRHRNFTLQCDFRNRKTGIHFIQRHIGGGINRCWRESRFPQH